MQYQHWHWHWRQSLHPRMLYESVKGKGLINYAVLFGVLVPVGHRQERSQTLDPHGGSM
jgi:hypothetical protein